MKIAHKTKSLPSFLTPSVLKESPTVSNYECTLVEALKSSPSHPKPLLHGQHLHCHILKYGHENNVFIRNSLISLYTKFGTLKDAESMFVSAFQSDSVSCNIMLAAYVKFGRLNDARQLFDTMPGKNGISYTTMIMGLAKNGSWYEVVRVFKEMRVLGLVLNEVTLASVLSSYSHVSGRKNGHMLHALVAKSGFEEFNLVVTNLVHVYCASSCLDYARILFDGMFERNIVAWNVMLNGYSKAKVVGLARDLFDQMPQRDVVSWGTMIECVLQINRIQPNDVMVVDIISVCGGAVTRTRKAFQGFRYLTTI